jgi:formate/nitrite transporter FocA (FNT family)
MAKQINDLKEALNEPKRINEILDEQIETALRQHNRSNQDLFLSAISAGLEVGFSVFLMAVIFSLFNEIIHPSVLHVLIAIAYPLGFIFVIIGKSELFTEHTTLAVIPVLNRNATIKSLLVLWVVVYAGNLLGGYFFGYILSVLPERLNTIDNGSFYSLAEKLINHPWQVILGSAILAGWLMGLLSWLVTSSQETISRIIIIVLITSVIGIGGLHHSIVGSIEVFTATITSPEISLKDYFYVQAWATVGNLIGGVVFVAFIKYSHINPSKKSGKKKV